MVLNPIISGGLVTGSWTGSVRQILKLLLGILIYYSFVKVLGKEYLGDERTTAYEELSIDFDEL